MSRSRGRAGRQPFWPRAATWLALLLAVFAIGPSLAAGPRPAPPGSLKILARYPVPGRPDPATDVRWASDTSVYLAHYIDGVREIALDGKGTARQRLVPHKKQLGGFHSFQSLAVSGDTLAVADLSWELAWTGTRPEPDGTRIFHRWKQARLTVDMDLSGRRLLLLGIPNLDPDFAPHGTVAWLGTLDRQLEDLRPVLRDAAGAEVPHLDNCATLELGSARFLPNGSFVVVPGFQPGVHLFNAAGDLVRTWDSAALGLDVPACAEMTKQRRKWLNFNPAQRLALTNGLRLVDDILPLPQGPGLLVRSVKGGQAGWEIEALGPGPGPVTYSVPLTSERLSDHLRGDVRGDRIVLLRSPHQDFSIDDKPASELIVAELPPI